VHARHQPGLDALVHVGPGLVPEAHQADGVQDAQRGHAGHEVGEVDGRRHVRAPLRADAHLAAGDDVV
jgi:hypothetical protein